LPSNNFSTSNEIFISYSTKNKIDAGNISNILKMNGFKTFLAHDNIEVSQEWRDEIIKHLNNCKGLLAIVTDDFVESCWTHQECGYVMGMKKPIVCLIYTNYDKGFLESKQGIMMKETSLSNALVEVTNFFKTMHK